MKYSIQLNAKGKLQHLLTIEGLSRSHLLEILDRADEFLSFGKKIELKNKPILKGKSIFNIFLKTRLEPAPLLKSLQKDSLLMLLIFPRINLLLKKVKH